MTDEAFLSDLRTATQAQHQTLNRQIILRLPLCLPPNAQSPKFYARGIVLFAQIYFAFEHLLDEKLVGGPLIIHYGKCLPDLRRTERLRAYIDLMKERLGTDVAKEMDLLEMKGHLFRARIVSALNTTPHAVLAYIWTMYLALFNGGKWIRRQLHLAGMDFWQGEELPASFFDFNEVAFSTHVGEDLKTYLKKAVFHAASSLMKEERVEIIRETKHIFLMCSEMVHWLDKNT